MKNLFKASILLILTLFISCSDNTEEIENTNFIKMNVNGEELTFNSLVIDSFIDSGKGEEVIEITATIKNRTDRILTISIFKDALGANSLSDFAYFTNEGGYFTGSLVVSSDDQLCDGSPLGTNRFNFVTSTNNNETLSGNFSGELFSCEDNKPLNVTITNGLFSYNF